MPINETALEAATRRIYEDKGDRIGIKYVGWEHEPEEVKNEWRQDVRLTVAAYLAGCQ